MVLAVKRGHEDSLVDDKADLPDWLADDDDDELDNNKHGLLEELTNPEKEAQDNTELNDLLEALKNLKELEDKDGAFGHDAVMKICKFLTYAEGY